MIGFGELEGGLEDRQQRENEGQRQPTGKAARSEVPAVQDRVPPGVQKPAQQGPIALRAPSRAGPHLDRFGYTLQFRHVCS